MYNTIKKKRGRKKFVATCRGFDQSLPCWGDPTLFFFFFGGGGSVTKGLKYDGKKNLTGVQNLVYLVLNMVLFLKELERRDQGNSETDKEKAFDIS